MHIKSLEDLQQPDEAALCFSPLGLGASQPAAMVAAYHQETIGHLDLVEAVPDNVRKCFERVRTLHSYGVLNYDFYTVAYEQAQLVIEYALRERLIEYYGGKAMFVDGLGSEHEVQATNYDEIRAEVQKNRRRRTPHKRRLRLGSNSETIYFDGMLDSLLRWARGEGLLHGQRNRLREPMFARSRNHVAHAAGYQRLMPTDSAREISDLAEIINRLWGSYTPGGRYYPAPKPREVTAIGWTSGGGKVMRCAAQELKTSPSQFSTDSWTYVILRADLHDDDVMHFDAQYEMTRIPSELLWGPGTWSEAIAWVENEQPATDEVDILDRLFVIQYHDGRLFMPRQPGIVAGLEEGERLGTWHLARADYPMDSFGHLRQALSGHDACSPQGQCKQCAVDILGNGPWDKIMRLLQNEGVTPSPHVAPDVRVPSWWPRFNEIHSNGGWSVPNG